MPTITFECPDCGPIERQFSIMEAPPETVLCMTELVDAPDSDCFDATVCGLESARVWEAPEFICDRADQDVDHVPEQFRVSDRVRPETAAEGRRIEKAYQRKLDRTRREVSEAAGSCLAKTHEIPSQLYHGKIRQTGDKSYWLDEKNRNKHKSTRVDTYGRTRRGKG
ncbi:MAG: hypothetical protein V3S98_06280 [Dehalococcoidia bacterium]